MPKKLGKKFEKNGDWQKNVILTQDFYELSSKPLCFFLIAVHDDIDTSIWEDCQKFWLSFHRFIENFYFKT